MWKGNLLRNSKPVWAYIILAKYHNELQFDLKRVLILSKRTRYELEKLQKPGISDERMEKILRKRGSDFDTLIKHHHLHKDYHDRLVQAFEQNNIEVRSVHMKGYSDDAIRWADLVVPTGGDGTFLLAASKIRTTEKPIVGFNSDPKRSEGYLCLPQASSYQLSKAVKQIVKREYSWLFRNRIEVNLTRPKLKEDEVDSHEISRPTGAPKFDIEDADIEEMSRLPASEVLPYLALNEVFLGEEVSSQVSYFELDIPGYPRTRVKCSGLCVATGTGSTSWHLSMNRISCNAVRQILRLAGVHNTDAQAIADKFNKSLIFSPGDGRMFYTLRDLIVGRVSPNPPGLLAQNFTENIKVYSKCYSANLVIDGGRCYPFNDGAVATLVSKPENALRSLILS